eukprot:6088518-Prymnesium_polylepis.1
MGGTKHQHICGHTGWGVATISNHNPPAKGVAMAFFPETFFWPGAVLATGLPPEKARGFWHGIE